MHGEADKTAPASGSVEGSPNMEMNARELKTRLASLHGAFMQIGFQYIAEFAMLNENDSAPALIRRCNASLNLFGETVNFT